MLLLKGIGGKIQGIGNLISALEHIVQSYQETFTRTRRYSLAYAEGGGRFTRVRYYSLSLLEGGGRFTRIRRFYAIYTSEITI